MRERTFELQGRRPAQRADLDVLKQLAEDGGDPLRRAEIACRRAMLALRSGDPRGAEAAARQAMALATADETVELRLNAQRICADARVRQGDIDGGRQLVESGLAEARGRGLASVEARLLNVMSLIASRCDDMVGMLQYSRQATDLRSALGDRRNEAIGLANQGAAWLELGHLDNAAQALNRALLLHRAVGDRALEPLALLNLAQLALWRGDAALSLTLAQEARMRAETTQALDLQGLAWWAAGQATFDAGDLDASEAAFLQCADLCRSADLPFQHDAAAGLARLTLARDQPEAALARLTDILAAWPGQGSLSEVLPGALSAVGITVVCAGVLQRLGDVRAAGLLAGAHAELQARADAIVDVSLRDSFLRAVPDHAALQAAWLATAGPPG